MCREYDGAYYRLVNSKNDLVYPDGACAASSMPALLPVSVGSDAPGFLVVVDLFGPEPAIVGPVGQYFIADPLGLPARMTWVSRWHADTGSCIQDSGSARNLLPLVPVDIQLEFPLSFLDSGGEQRFIVSDQAWKQATVEEQF